MSTCAAKRAEVSLIVGCFFRNFFRCLNVFFLLNLDFACNLFTNVISVLLFRLHVGEYNINLK